jgi:cobalt-zinc-cadmium efflux system membrane fusion protein
MNSGSNTQFKKRYIFLTITVIVLLAAIFIPKFQNRTVEPTQLPQFEHKNGEVFLPEHSSIRDRVEIEEVNSKTVARTISSPASVEANPSKRANIFPPFNGRIVRLFVNMGDPVRSGQSLFEIYSPEAAEVQTEFISAKSALAQAERELRRKEALHERGISSLRELEEAQTAYEIAQSEKEGITQKMNITGLSLTSPGGPLVVKSPINGRIVALDVASGEFINEAEEPLLIIADLSTVWVTASIQEKDLRFINKDLNVSIKFTAYPGETFEGKVLFVNDILDAETRTTRVRIEIDNPDFKIKPGMFANVNFHTSPEPAIVVPPGAVLQRRDFNYVYVETAPHTFEMRKVTTGETIDNQVIVLSGLTEGEKVIVKNAVLLP